MHNVDLNQLASLINKNVSGANATVNAAPDAKLDSSVSVEASHIYKVAEWLRSNTELPFNALQAISGVDYLDYMDVCYVLAHFDVDHPRELILKVRVTDRVEPKVDSIMKVYPAADWQEREVYDMFGIKFNNHKDLRRILCPDDWQGWPLRKDYVAQKFYNGMEVYPDNKMNFEDRDFIVRQAMIKKAQETKAQ
ncbi:MAG: NADH-quinone oxidoreductase subunit C [Bdellovibrionota bacterium]